MTVDAYQTVKNQYDKQSLTHKDFGVNEKHTLIVPSFGTTSKIFAQHLSILRSLKSQIQRLYDAYADERSQQESWRAINNVLDVIDQGI